MNSQFTSRSNLIPMALCALIVLGGIAAYANSMAGVFVFDDQRQIVENKTIRSLWPLGPLVADASRPVVVVSLAANYQFGQLNVFGYHVVNLAIHLAAGLVLFGFVRRTLWLVPQYSSKSATADFLAFAVAIVWLVHPLATESVTYVIGRSESMMGLFYLVCMYCVLRGSQASRSGPWYVAAVAACWLGMGTKQVMVTAPVVTLLYDRIFLSASWAEIRRRRWALYVGFLPALGWLVFATLTTVTQPGAASAGFGLRGITWYEYLGTQGGVILHYVRLAFWPDQLCLDYRWPVAESPWKIVVPGAVVAALLAVSLVAIRRWPRLGFLGLSFFLILAPTSSIMPINDLAVEHRMYLPLIALVLLVVLAFDTLARRCVARGPSRQGLEAVALLIVIVSLAMRTIDRNRDYHHPATMWNDVLATSPRNARAHNNLGKLLQLDEKYDEAAAYYERAIRFNPNYAKVHNNLGLILTRQGKYDQASASFRQAIKLMPDFADAHNHFGVVLLRQGNLVDAHERFEHAIRIAPGNEKIHNNLGNLYQRQGKFEAAAAAYRQAIRLDPDYADAHNNLGIVQTRQENYRDALSAFEQALRINPDFSDTHNNLGVVLLRQGELAEARGHFEDAIRLDPDHSQAHGNLGTLLLQLGDVERGIAQLRQALRLEPGFQEAAVRLSWVLATSNDPAVRDGREAVRLAERWATATRRQDPAVLDVLAAAYAETGSWDEAVATARQAVKLAAAAGRAAQAEQIEGRLRLYQQQTPFRGPFAQ